MGYIPDMFLELSWTGRLYFLVTVVAVAGLSGWLLSGKRKILLHTLFFCLSGVIAALLGRLESEVGTAMLGIIGIFEGVVAGGIREENSLDHFLL